MDSLSPKDKSRISSVSYDGLQSYGSWIYLADEFADFDFDPLDGHENILGRNHCGIFIQSKKLA